MTWFRRKAKPEAPAPRRSPYSAPVQAPAYDDCPVLTTAVPDKVALEDVIVAMDAFRDIYGHYATKILLVDEHSGDRDAALWIVS